MINILCELCGRLIDYLKKRGLFSNFQCGFRTSCSIANLSTVLADKIVMARNMSCTARDIALAISLLTESSKEIFFTNLSLPKFLVLSSAVFLLFKQLMSCCSEQDIYRMHY